MSNSIDVTEEITSCLRALGAVIADDTTAPDKRTNADFWFPAEQVAAELKCMSEDYFKEQSYREWLNGAYKSWVIRGLAPHIYAQQQVINLANLPPICYHEVTSFLRKRIDGSLKVASRQINASKTHYGCPDATGLLILVNDGNYGIIPAMVQDIVARSLHKYSGINSVIHFTANMPSSSPNTPKDVLFWCAWSKIGLRPGVAESLLVKIRNAWFHHHDKLLGGPIEILPGSDQALGELKFIRR